MRLYLFNLMTMCAIIALYSDTSITMSVKQEPSLNPNSNRVNPIENQMMNVNVNVTSSLDKNKNILKIINNHDNSKRTNNICKEHTNGFDEKIVLKVLMPNNAPFTFYNKNRSHFSGIEIRLMETIKRVLKIDVVYEYEHFDELKDMVETKY